MTIDQVEKAIRAGNDVWNRAFQEQSGKLFASVFHEDGAVCSQGGVLTTGHEALEAAIQPFMDQVGPMECLIRTAGIWFDGGLIYESGYYTYQAGAKVIGTGTYVVMWKADAQGKLKIWRDIGIAAEKVEK